MVNIYESLINAVSSNKPKMLTSPEGLKGLNQKVSGQALVILPHQSQAEHHRQRGEP